MTASQGEHHARGERRKSYRCPVQGARRRGRLKIGLRNVVVEVLDESAQGLALEAEGIPDCQIGDTVFVEIAAAWVEARIVNLRLNESVPEDSEDGALVTRTRIGLVRLGEVEASLVDPQEFVWFSSMRFRSLLVPLVPLGKSFRGTALLIAAVIAAGGVLVWVLENSAPLAEAMRPDAAGQTAKSPGESFTPSDKKTSSRSKPARPQKKSAAAASSKPLRPSPPAQAQQGLPAAEVVRLAHPDFLLKPEITKLLDLSRNQREQLRQLFRQHKASAETAASAASPGDDDPLVRLGRRAWEILTARQRQSLSELHAAMSSMPGAAAPAEPSAPPDERLANDDEPADAQARPEER
jgi:hypothetical protein